MIIMKKKNENFENIDGFDSQEQMKDNSEKNLYYYLGQAIKLLIIP